MMEYLSVLGALFLVAFFAATIFPAQSETLLAALILSTDISLWILILVASVGNILGSCLNWLLGRHLETYKERRWFPVKPQMLERAQGHYSKYGRWSLLLSWVPIIGDPITVVAGVMKERLPIFLAIVSASKTARYVFIAISVQFFQS